MSICHDKFVPYITFVLVCGRLHKLSISAIISKLFLFAINITTRFCTRLETTNIKFVRKSKTGEETDGLVSSERAVFYGFRALSLILNVSFSILWMVPRWQERHRYSQLGAPHSFPSNSESVLRSELAVVEIGFCLAPNLGGETICSTLSSLELPPPPHTHGARPPNLSFEFSF